MSHIRIISGFNPDEPGPEHLSTFHPYEVPFIRIYLDFIRMLSGFYLFSSWFNRYERHTVSHTILHTILHNVLHRLTPWSNHLTPSFTLSWVAGLAGPARPGFGQVWDFQRFLSWNPKFDDLPGILIVKFWIWGFSKNTYRGNPEIENLPGIPIVAS